MPHFALLPSGATGTIPGTYGSQLPVFASRGRPLLQMDPTDSQRTDFFERFRAYFSRPAVSPGADEDGAPPRTIAIIVCFAISGILWLTFTMQETHEIVLPLELQVENMPSDQMLADSLPRSIRVTVEAERVQLLRLIWDPPTVPINVGTERISVEEVIPPLGNVRVQGVSPSVIEPRLEPQVARRIPIQLRHAISTPSSHDFLVPPTITPDSVLVTGARSVVNSLRFWPTKVIEHEGLRDTLEARVALSDTLSSLVQRRPNEVSLMAVAGEFVGSIREIDVHVQGVPSGEQVVVLDPPSVRVRYRVLFSHYEQALHAPDFYAEVSYDQIRNDRTGRVHPELHTPENLEVRDVEMVPATVGYFDVVSDQ